MGFVDITGALNGTSAYVGGQLMGREVKLSLPEVAPTVAEVQAMGTMEVPMMGIFDAMEAKITKIGIDMGLAKAVTFETKTYEFRWVQDVTKSDGSHKSVGCKAFLKAIPKVIPGMDLELGSTVEAEIPLAASRYQVFVDGKELWCIDRLAQVFRVNGKDYFSQINSML